MPPPSASLPVLSVLPAFPTPAFGRPAKRIRDGTDVARFLSSQAYRDIGIFVLQLNRAVVPRRSSPGGGGDQGIRTWPLAALPAEPCPSSRSIAALGRLLERVGALLADAPPDPGPRRFGNAAFRAWYALLEQHAPALFDELVRDSTAPHLAGVEADRQGGEGGRADYIAARDEILAYLLGSFGSPQRLDYGTGHELSFLAFLGCLWKLGFFVPARPATGAETSPDDANPSSAAADMDVDTSADSVTETSRAIVLRVFEPYLATVRTLIQTYTLEPAGSHGVWGLDDHSFLPYIFGSAQLARPIAANPAAAEPTPLEGSVGGAPAPVAVADAAAVERWRGLNMYFSAVGFIYDVKTGPFWEHSPMLYDISGVRDGWGKINKGMIKMFNAEVLSKFPVVQHFPFGALFSWDLDPDAAPPVATTSSMHIASQPAAQPAFSLASGIGAPRLRSAISRMPPPQRPPPPPPAMPAPGPAGTTAAQITVTKAPWARDG